MSCNYPWITSGSRDQTAGPLFIIWPVFSAIAFAAITSTVFAQNRTTSFFHPLADSAPSVQYERYSATECLAAVVRAGATARRSQATSNEAWDQSFLENDTVLAIQRTTASDCVRHITIDATPVYALPDLARVYWFSGDTLAMRRTIAHRLTLDKTDSARAVTYRQLLTRFLLEKQRDVTFAFTQLLPALDSLTTLGAQAARFQTHVALAYTFASSRLPNAGAASGVQIDEAIREFERMPAILQTQMVDTVGPLFRLGAAEATERGDTTRARALLETARRLLPKLPDGARYVHEAEAIVRYFGMTAPPISADFVYGAPTGAESVKSWPRPGRWTLIAPMPQGSYLAGFYKNLREQLGDTIDIVFFMATRSYWRPHGPLTPQDEGKLAYDFLSRRWKTPGTLLVEARTYRKLPDGRRIGEATATPSIYQQNGLVVDPQGTIRAMIEPSTLVRFDLLLQSLMRRDIAKAAD
jgi:hypothetical protein